MRFFRQPIYNLSFEIRAPLQANRELELGGILITETKAKDGVDSMYPTRDENIQFLLCLSVTTNPDNSLIFSSKSSFIGDC